MQVRMSEGPSQACKDCDWCVLYLQGEDVLHRTRALCAAAAAGAFDNQSVSN